MTKADIVKQISSRTGVSRQTAAIIVDELLSTIKEDMTQGHNIYLRGFGTFAIRRHNTKHVYIINTGSTTVIPAHCTPVFKAGKDFSVTTR